MKENMGTLDKSIRIIVALTVAALYFLEFINGTLAIVLMFLAVIFIATSFMSFCPLYLPFGINTKRKNTSI
ncbi:MAG: DUF2892 domain-containing protein [Bacteroidetes bacterium]|nr:DUF2892 domain-containing protein [Bacteroidota bacterium]MBU1483570.1 DUF2892 domain-containing protein [Bacteroidota bacterium]MBU2267973.1 DUF2892 domain-containing protein [Bacteroidota bacterium]MBU2375893.1 DUF2892 domain-containing protein [Bacteroidota bacterium]